jgi:hypothetical protein
VANLPRGHDAIGVPEGFAGWPIMDRASLLEAIIAVAPGADCSDPTRVRLDGHGYSIVIDIAGDPVTSLAIAVRSGALAAGVVADILGELGLQAVPLERERRRVYRAAYAALATRTARSTNSAPAAGGSSNGRLAGHPLEWRGGRRGAPPGQPRGSCRSHGGAANDRPASAGRRFGERVIGAPSAPTSSV